MEAIKLMVSVPAAAAVRGGSPRAGSGVVPLTEEHLAALSAEEREVLATALVYNPGIVGTYRLEAVAGCGAEALELAAPDTDPEAVVGALRVRLSEIAAARARRATAERADLTRIVAETLAMEVGDATPASPPWDRWRSPTPQRRDEDVARAVRLGIEGAKEAQEHLAALAAEVDRRNAAAVAEAAERYCALPLERRVHLTKKGWMPALPEGCEGHLRWHYNRHPAVKEAHEEACEECCVRDRADEERKAADLAAENEALVAFALTIPDLAPAAREGYDIRKGVMDEVARRVATIHKKDTATYLPSEVYAQGGRGWDPLDWEEAPSPGAALLALRSIVLTHVEAMGRPACLKVVVHRVARVVTADLDADRDPYQGQPVRKRRGIVVVIDGATENSTLPQRVVVFPGE